MPWQDLPSAAISCCRGERGHQRGLSAPPSGEARPRLPARGCPPAAGPRPPSRRRPGPPRSRRRQRWRAPRVSRPCGTVGRPRAPPGPGPPRPNSREAAARPRALTAGPGRARSWTPPPEPESFPGLSPRWEKAGAGTMGVVVPGGGPRGAAGAVVRAAARSPRQRSRGGHGASAEPRGGTGQGRPKLSPPGAGGPRPLRLPRERGDRPAFVWGPA